jgi:hypothetical protein
MKTKEVKCISNYLFEDKLTVGKNYLVIDRVEDKYVIGDDYEGSEYDYLYFYIATVPQNHFEDIV